MTKGKNGGGITIHRPASREAFNSLNNKLNERGFVALEALRPGIVRSVTLGERDSSKNVASDMAARIGKGVWSNGPLSNVAWSFDAQRDSSVHLVKDADGKDMGLGYVDWGPGNNIPSTIPVLALASPYTAAPLRYIADLTAGLGVRLMYRFPDGSMVEFKDAGELLKDDEEAYADWERTWYGYDEKDDEGYDVNDPGAKKFLEENNLDLHFSQCEQDDVMLDIYFPTVGLQRGRKGRWNPKIVEVSMLPCNSTRLEKMNEYRHINHVYFSDKWRTLGVSTSASPDKDNNNIVMYPAAMPQQLLKDLRYIVSSHKKSTIKGRPTWVVCPTFYPSGQKPYYPQPAWWSVFTSKAYDFSSTILYDKAKQRENRTSWGRIMYISLDYLERTFATRGIAGDEKKQLEFIDELESSMEEFLQHRENQGKFMRQWMWTDEKGTNQKNIEIVDIKDAVKEEVAAGKDELELSTSPIFLALQVDPRLVGVPMVHSSNGGTALREMHLLKQQQLNVKQRLYLHFLNSIIRFNEWSERAEFHICQQTLTTLDNSKTGTVDTIAGEKA